MDQMRVSTTAVANPHPTKVRNAIRLAALQDAASAVCKHCANAADPAPERETRAAVPISTGAWTHAVKVDRLWMTRMCDAADIHSIALREGIGKYPEPALQQDTLREQLAALPLEAAEVA